MNCDFAIWSDDCKKQLTDLILKNKNKDGSNITNEQASCVQNKITTHWKNYGEFVNSQSNDQQNSTQFIMDSINQCKKSNSITIAIAIISILLAIGVGYYFLKIRK